MGQQIPLAACQCGKLKAEICWDPRGIPTPSSTPLSSPMEPSFHPPLPLQYPMTALTLTFFSGMASALGGLVVVCYGVPSPRTLAHLISFASGIMLYVSYADLLAHAVDGINASYQADSHHHPGHDHHHHGHDHHEEEHGHSHGPGHFEANVCMLIGMLVWGIIALFIPTGGDGGHDHHSHGGSIHDSEHSGEEVSPKQLAAPLLKGEEEVVASSLSARSSSRGRVSPSPSSSSSSKSSDGAAGALRRRRSTSGSRRGNSMVAASDGGLSKTSTSGAKLTKRQSSSSATATASSTAAAAAATRRRLMMTGLITALGITLHNLPEGLVVYNSTLGGVCDAHAPPCAPGTYAAWLGLPRDLRACMGSGLAVAFAIALHNIPEGMAVASPILAATGSPWQAMKLTLAASAVEPLAAVVFGFFFNSFITNKFMWQLNAGVAGVMIALCFGELMPASLASITPKVS